MKRPLGLLIAAASLTACGVTTQGATGLEGVTGTATAQQSASAPATAQPATWTLVEILDITSAGGTVTDVLQPLSQSQQVDDFVAGLASGQAADRVRAAVRAAEIPPDHRLMGAVVAQGCEPPSEVTVRTGSGAPTVEAEVGQRNLQCLAAITSVALVSVRADLIL